MELHKLVDLRRARELIALLQLRPPPVEHVKPYEAGWRIAARSIVAHKDIPAVPLAAMDGYALRSSDLKAFPALKLKGEVKPGDEPPALGEGEAYYVNMGAPLPAGADAVARVEATRVEGGLVKPLEPVRPGKDVIPKGEVVERGAVVIERGELVKPYKLPILSMLGVQELEVFKVRVGVLNVGDEVDRFDKPTGKPVIDSLSPMVMGLMRGLEPKYLGVVGDREEEIAAAVEEGLREAEALITIGGASAGESDNVKRALSRVGEVLFPGVSVSVLKRGGVALVGGKPVVALPAQCVAAALVFHEHFLHILSRMVGRELREFAKARLAEDVEVRHRMDAAYLFKLEGERAYPLRWGTGLCGELAKADAFGVLS
ncbi:MAG: molybdopterin molybdotransferase MoeA, partial [Acidilobaceae archaeon]|nr:molybdopterin molybdotransferase MoeA [Acidilobaceae archaeon]